MRAAAVGALLLTAGCATTAPGGGGSPGGSVEAGAGRSEAFPLERRVEPFPVLDSTGTPLDMPFLGGFNVPRPQWVDIDGDGDLDLFVQERTDELLFFERLPDEGGEHRYAFRPDRFDDLEVGEWFRFVDVDGDGDPDLLAEEPFSYMRLWLNEGTAGGPDFTLAADTIRDTSGAPIFSDRQNIPNAVDLDCDGLLDLLVGKLTGTITHYEATGEVGSGGVAFRKVTDRFEGIEIIGEYQLPSMHGANTMALADWDGDGDVDLFWGDFFEPGLLLIENTGTCEAPDLTTPPRPFPIEDPLKTSGYNAPTFGDVDADGDLDLLIGVLGGAYNANTTTADNLLFFENVEGGGYEIRSSRYLSQVDVGSESVPAFLDLDGDDDLDLLLANRIDPQLLNTSVIYVFENTGTRDAPELRRSGTLDVEGAYHNAPAFGDLDADGDLDLVLGTWRDELLFFRNEGTPSEPRFTRVDSAFVTLTRGSNASPTLGDLDGDGDLDLVVGESSGSLNFYRNVGGPGDPSFELVSDEWLGIDVGRRSAPELVDVDADGDLDLVVGTESDGLLLYRNGGSPDEAAFADEPETVLSPERTPTFTAPTHADLDGDGRPELFLGSGGGGLYFFERAGSP